MKLTNRLFNIFLFSSDEDLTAEDIFKVSFANVVNFFLLVYSLTIGLSFLFREMFYAALTNLVFSLVFVVYFVVAYLIKWTRVFELIDRSVIFLYFIVVYANCAYMGYSGMTIIIYPFIAIVMNGRRAGVWLSFLNVVLVVLCSLLLYDIDPRLLKFSNLEIVSILVIQIASIFVYYVAIRWLSNLIYDKIHEVIMLNNEVKVKGELVSHILAQVEGPAADIDQAATQLMKERMSRSQTEMSTVIKASVNNIYNALWSIKKASEYSIRPILQEIVVFNVYSLISSVLVIYEKKSHSISISSEVPQTVLGNSILTRQIFLNTFDSLNRKIGLENQPVRVVVNLADLTVHDIVLTYQIAVDKVVTIDRRDLTSSDSQLIEMLELDVTRRMVLASGGQFTVSTDSEGLHVEFSLPYRNADDESMYKMQTGAEVLSEPIGNGVCTLGEASVLVVDDNTINQKIVSLFIKDSVRKVTTADGGREAVNLFENNKFDIILLDLQMPDMDGFETARAIRAIEGGFGGRRTPIIAVTANSFADNESRCYAAGMDGFISKPFKAEDLLSLMNKNL